MKRSETMLLVEQSIRESKLMLRELLPRVRRARREDLAATREIHRDVVRKLAPGRSW